LYENLGKDGPVEEPGTKVTRTQWLDLSSLEMSNLVGKNILIVDEVDDTRTTLEYAVKELEKDVETARQRLGREGSKTRFSIFVLHVHPLNLMYNHGDDAEIDCRTRISRRRAIYPMTWWKRTGIWLHRLWEMCGYVTLGKLRKFHEQVLDYHFLGV